VIAKVTPATFETQVLKSAQPVVVDVWAPWCGPCQAMAPILEQSARQFTGQARFVKLNAHEYADFSRQFKVLGIPTLLYFSHGRLVDRSTGLQSADTIAKRLTPLLSLSAEAAAGQEISGFFSRRTQRRLWLAGTGLALLLGVGLWQVLG